MVLRSARGRVRLRRHRPRDEPRTDRGRSRELVAVRRSASGRVRSFGRSRHRLHAARARRPARGGARPGRGVDQERHRNPTNSFKDRVVSIALSKALEFGFKVAACAVDRQPRELGRGARRARRVAQLRVHPVEPRAGQGRHHVGLRRQRRRDRGQLRRRQPAVRRARRHLRLGVRERQHAPVLRRGLQDARVRDRGAARLAGSRPRGRSRRERIAAHQDPEGLPGAPPGRPARRGAERARVGRRRSGVRRSPPRSSRSPTRSGR